MPSIAPQQTTGTRQQGYQKLLKASTACTSNYCLTARLDFGLTVPEAVPATAGLADVVVQLPVLVGSAGWVDLAVVVTTGGKATVCPAVEREVLAGVEANKLELGIADTSKGVRAGARSYRLHPAHLSPPRDLLNYAPHVVRLDSLKITLRWNQKVSRKRKHKGEAHAEDAPADSSMAVFSVINALGLQHNTLDDEVQAQVQEMLSRIWIQIHQSFPLLFNSGLLQHLSGAMNSIGKLARATEAMYERMQSRKGTDTASRFLADVHRLQGTKETLKMELLEILSPVKADQVIVTVRGTQRPRPSALLLDPIERTQNSLRACLLQMAMAKYPMSRLKYKRPTVDQVEAARALVSPEQPSLPTRSLANTRTASLTSIGLDLQNVRSHADMASPLGPPFGRQSACPPGSVVSVAQSRITDTFMSSSPAQSWGYGGKAQASAGPSRPSTQDSTQRSSGHDSARRSDRDVAGGGSSQTHSLASSAVFATYLQQAHESPGQSGYDWRHNPALDPHPFSASTDHRPRVTLDDDDILSD